MRLRIPSQRPVLHKRPRQLTKKVGVLSPVGSGEWTGVVVGPLHCARPHAVRKGGLKHRGAGLADVGEDGDRRGLRPQVMCGYLAPYPTLPSLHLL